MDPTDMEQFLIRQTRHLQNHCCHMLFVDVWPKHKCIFTFAATVQGFAMFMSTFHGDDVTAEYDPYYSWKHQRWMRNEISWLMA